MEGRICGSVTTRENHSVKGGGSFAEELVVATGSKFPNQNGHIIVILKSLFSFLHYDINNNVKNEWFNKS